MDEAENSEGRGRRNEGELYVCLFVCLLWVFGPYLGFRRMDTFVEGGGELVHIFGSIFLNLTLLRTTRSLSHKSSLAVPAAAITIEGREGQK